MIGGIIPAVLWLCFWLREDNKHPEPERMIVITFIAGILSIIPTYFAEAAVASRVTDLGLTLTVWALIEELAKFSAAYLTALRTRIYDEPMDAVIYMITAALGFAAAENFLFIINSPDAITSVLTGGIRFVGASLSHNSDSATIGSLMALTFKKHHLAKIAAIIFGILTSALLHTSFNVFIMKDKGSDTSVVFISLWLAVIFLILFFEKLRVEDNYK